MKLPLQPASRSCATNLWPILHSSNALISAGVVDSQYVASPLPNCVRLARVCVKHLYMCWCSQQRVTKILPVDKAATCAQVHVQIVFRSKMIQWCGVPLPCSLLQHRPAALACEGCLTIPCTWTQFAWSHFFFGPRQLRFGRAPVPVLLVPCPLPSCRTKLTDVDVRFLRSTAH